jgi:toxin CcdB
LAQFDVHRLGKGLVVDCQSDLLAHLNTRVVVPLIPSAQAPKPARRFNPAFSIDGAEQVMDTQFVSAVERRELGAVVASLADHSFEITGALDVLISGV